MLPCLLFDSFAATEKRFSADQQVSRTFTAAEWQALDEAPGRSAETASLEEAGCWAGC